MPQPPKILINAMHTVVGGGVTFLRSLLPSLAYDQRFRFELLIPARTLQEIDVPANVVVRPLPEMGFVRGHFFEQLQLPFLCRVWGIKAVLCNANFVPLLAPRPLPMIHTTVRAAGQAKSTAMRVYWWVLKVLTTLSIYRCKVGFTIARHVVADYVRSPRQQAKLRLAPPAVEVFSADVQRDPNLVMAVGDFYAQKDYPTLVRAFAVLREKRPETRLLIVGRPLDPAVRDDVLGLIRSLGIADAVTLTGSVPREVLLATMAKAAVYFSTSRAETVQLPLLEAMALGVPVVAASAPHSLEFVGDAGILVDPDKGGDLPSAYAVALYALLENGQIAETLRRRGRAKMNGFDWNKTARVVGDGLADVLK